MTRIAYLVHDLADAQVKRRVQMLLAAGAELQVGGFQRSAGVVPELGAPATSFGVTLNGKLAHRALSVLRLLARSEPVRRVVQDADVVIARTLEMLILAHGAVRGSVRRPRIVYECLDVHRSLSGSRLPHRLFRGLERRLIAASDLLITSSPRFITEHFERDGPLAIPYAIVENKVLALGDPPVPQRDIAAGPPWIIGWFGMLRCRKSLGMIEQIVAAGQGRIGLLVAGKPSYNEMPDFDARIAAIEGARFTGAYTADDLAALYGQTHFAWSIDFMEEGQNSAWLLPNRLYEATAYGAVPIALEAVETGNWLRERNIGLVIADPVRDVPAALHALDAEDYVTMQTALASLPREMLIFDRSDSDRLLELVRG